MKWLPLNESSAPAVFHAKFHEAFDMVSCTIFAAKLGRCGLNDWNTTGVIDWLDCQAQRITVAQKLVKANYKYCLTPEESYQLQHAHLQPSAPWNGTHNQKAHTGHQTGGVLDNAGWQSCHPEEMTSWRKHTKNFLKLDQGKNQSPVPGTKPPLAKAVE